MRKVITAVATVGILLAGCSAAETEETSLTESTVETTSSFDTDQIADISDQARKTCLVRTTFKEQRLSTSEYKPNDFHAAYIEEDGRYIRYVMLGTVDISQDDGTIAPVGYMCAYLQREKVNAPASSDSLGVILEDEAITSIAEIEAIEDLRDYLRDFHGDAERIVYEGDYGEISDGWADNIVVESSSPVSSTSRASAPVSSMDRVYAETVRSFGVEISDQQFAAVSAPVCDSYENGGDLNSALGVVLDVTGHDGWRATRVVQGVVVSKCPDFSDLTY